MHNKLFKANGDISCYVRSFRVQRTYCNYLGHMMIYRCDIYLVRAVLDTYSPVTQPETSQKPVRIIQAPVCSFEACVSGSVFV